MLKVDLQKETCVMVIDERLPLGISELSCNRF